jgi:TolA-binding protein
MENEIARLNTKVEALETKLASLDSRASEEAVRSAQPKLSAVASSDDPHANESLSNDQDPEAMESGNVSSRLATKLPPVTKMAAESSSSLIAGEEMDSSPTISGSVEKDFQASMRFFENGNYKEAANRFFAVSKEYKNHILASHALYWAGESAAKAKNWKIAISHFSNLETNYPRSVYMADALAGLANAYSASANPTKARHYQQVTTSAFPEVAATMEFSSTSKLSSAQPEGE